MELRKLHQLARDYKSYSDFKSKVDKHFNGTPETVVDNSVYKLVKFEVEASAGINADGSYYLKNRLVECKNDRL
jgi:hypothetical protein